MRITQSMHEQLQRPGAPAGLIVGLAIVEDLCDATLNHSHEDAADIATEVCQKPAVANAVLAAAIGVLCSCEKSLSQAAEHMEQINTNDPETAEKIRQYVGAPVEDAQT